jgi:hypothetical protein
MAELQQELRGGKYVYNIVEGANQWYYVKFGLNSPKYLMVINRNLFGWGAMAPVGPNQAPPLLSSRSSNIMNAPFSVELLDPATSTSHYIEAISNNGVA